MVSLFHRATTNNRICSTHSTLSKHVLLCRRFLCRQLGRTVEKKFTVLIIRDVFREFTVRNLWSPYVIRQTIYIFMGTPANLNWFHVLAALLQRPRSPAANQTLHDVWPSPGLVHYIYTFGGSCPLTEFCQVQNSLCVQVLRCHTLPALLHGTRVVGSAKLCGVEQRVPPMFGRAAIRLDIGSSLSRV